MLYIKSIGFFRCVIVAALAWVCILPLVTADFFIEIYHRITFPLCKMPCVKRSKYIKIDRYKLKYLTFLQKFNCVYCGYGNGVVRYWGQIFKDTESYWCGVQHKSDRKWIAPEHHKNFAKYGDKKGFEEKYHT
jgi:hypothetical protein